MIHFHRNIEDQGVPSLPFILAFPTAQGPIEAADLTSRETLHDTKESRMQQLNKST
jgi:hypothetical protein